MEHFFVYFQLESRQPMTSKGEFIATIRQFSYRFRLEAASAVQVQRATASRCRASRLYQSPTSFRAEVEP
jgi:hypothetical protein